MNTIAKTDRCVVRNQAYRRAEISIRERHNERKNMDYQNPDIITERSHLNVHLCALWWIRACKTNSAKGKRRKKSLPSWKTVFKIFHETCLSQLCPLLRPTHISLIPHMMQLSYPLWHATTTSTIETQSRKSSNPWIPALLSNYSSSSSLFSPGFFNSSATPSSLST